MKNSMKLMTMLTLALLFVGAAQAESVKVMSFNIWVGGGDSLDDTITAIQNSGADIIGLQEAGSGSFGAIASALGFYSDYGSYTLSRWPIIEVQGYGYGQAVTICTPTGQEVYMFNCHLTAYPYPPYALPDEAKALREERRTQWRDLEPILENMASYIATGKPVFLTGDFNICSHLDYDGIVWRCSTECAAAGLTDSWRAVNGPPGGHLWPPDWAYDDSGISWTPKPDQEPEGKFDRIDFVYCSGTDVSVLSSEVTSSLVTPWPSDHRAVVSTITIPDGPGGDCNHANPTLTLDKSWYLPGEAIVATFGNGPGNNDDWIGIYNAGETPAQTSSQAWLYTNGTQHAGGGGGPTDGSVTFDNSTGAPVWPLPEGPYDAYFICCDGWTELAGPASFTVSTGGPCTPTDIHIAAVACGGVNCGAGKKNGKATVTIEDDCGNAVENALVDGTFTGDFNESFNDVPTDATGKAEFITAGCIKGASFTFTVDDVTGGSLPYDPGDDVETGCIK